MRKPLLNASVGNSTALRGVRIAGVCRNDAAVELRAGQFAPRIRV
jgi:hypothetical protein